MIETVPVFSFVNKSCCVILIALHLSYEMEVGKSTNNKAEESDVIVIGCGLSGLTAAYEIFKIEPNTNLCLLEAKGNKKWF